VVWEDEGEGGGGEGVAGASGGFEGVGVLGSEMGYGVSWPWYRYVCEDGRVLDVG